LDSALGGTRPTYRRGGSAVAWTRRSAAPALRTVAAGPPSLGPGARRHPPYVPSRRVRRRLDPSARRHPPYVPSRRVRRRLDSALGRTRPTYRRGGSAIAWTRRSAGPALRTVVAGPPSPGHGARRDPPHVRRPGAAEQRCRANADPALYRISRVVVGRANRAASMAAFGRISLITIVTWLRVEVLIHLNGRLTPATSR